MRIGICLAVMGMLVGAASVAGETVVFTEPFRGELSEGWSWLRERPEDWRLSDGGLELRSRPGLADTVTTALVRPAPALDGGKWVFEVTVTFLNDLTEQFEQAGL